MSQIWAGRHVSLQKCAHEILKLRVTRVIARCQERSGESPPGPQRLSALMSDLNSLKNEKSMLVFQSGRPIRNPGYGLGLGVKLDMKTIEKHRVGQYIAGGGL